MKREDQEALLGKFWASGTKRKVFDGFVRDWDDEANELMGKILDEMAPSPAVKRLVEIAEAAIKETYWADGSRTPPSRTTIGDLEQALAAVGEEMGELPAVTCENCGKSFPENQLPDADMKGEVVCRKCIEKMALGNQQDGTFEP